MREPRKCWGGAAPWGAASAGVLDGRELGQVRRDGFVSSVFQTRILNSRTQLSIVGQLTGVDLLFLNT